MVSQVEGSAGPKWCSDDDRALAVEVTIDRVKKEVRVSHESVEVVLGGGPGKPLKVCWPITGMIKGDRLFFRDKTAGEPDYFPNRDRFVPYSNAPRGKSGLPSQIGTWTYELELIDGNGNRVAVLDPEVQIKQGP